MKCPHCLNSFHAQPNRDIIGNGPEGSWATDFQICPNPECSKSIIFLNLISRFNTTPRLIYPKNISRIPIPMEIEDESLINDYKESSLILVDSPKASAALSRRCLQHILRERAGIKNGDLNNEIQQVLNKNSLPSDIAENLDAVRHIGNFATHPIKSTSTGEIVEVETDEADWNLEMVEQLMDFYYVKPAIARKKRDELNQKLEDAGKPPIKSYLPKD